MQVKGYRNGLIALEGAAVGADAELTSLQENIELSGEGGAVVGGAGLLSGVLLPLLGGIGLAYGASQLLSRSGPSAEVYQRSEYGTVGSGGEATRTVSSNSGVTRASQEGTPTLEANLNVTVEASGTRLGQANERVKLKTSRWCG